MEFKLSERISLKQMAEQLANKQVSAVELAQQALDAVEASALNAFIDVQPELTLAQAREADARRTKGESGVLLGVPIAHKDVFVTQGWRSTAASRMLANYMSPFDATVVARLKDAGTVCVGKTNCDEFGMGSTNEYSYFGPVHNPWDFSAIPGGSSGGSAAAVAAGLVPVATATDTGGSVRQPAAMCGVTGLKPTYGRASRYGMIAFASSLDQAGVIGTSAWDCAQVLNVIAGVDARDATSVSMEAEDFSRMLDAPLSGMRLGVPAEFFSEAEGVSEEVRVALEEALVTFRSLGAVCIPVSLPMATLAVPAYYVIASAEASSNLARFDGVRYGHRAGEVGSLDSLYLRTRSEGFGPEVKRRILVGTYVLSEGYYDAYYRRAQRLRRAIADDFRRTFDQVDLVLAPVAPSVARDIQDVPVGEASRSGDGAVRDYLSDIFTLPVSLAGLPAMSIPVGFGRKNRPVGMQLIARPFEEAKLCGVAHQFQQVTGWHLRYPGDHSKAS